ncbi:MAG: hypothetical protein ACP5XB_05835 [Isosphaeraceae bacterium]
MNRVLLAAIASSALALSVCELVTAGAGADSSRWAARLTDRELSEVRGTSPSNKCSEYAWTCDDLNAGNNQVSDAVCSRMTSNPGNSGCMWCDITNPPGAWNVSPNNPGGPMMQGPGFNCGGGDPTPGFIGSCLCLNGACWCQLPSYPNTTCSGTLTTWLPQY